MKKVLFVVSVLFFTVIANAQISLAVMEFKPGSNMKTNVNGLSDMLINSLFDTGNYDIIERSQIEAALRELNIQGTDLSVAQLTQLGQYLKVDNVLVGTVNFIATGNSSDPGFQVGEYNIDVRIVDVTSSRVVATAGVVKDGNQTYRSLMPKLARQLSEKLTVSNILVLDGYLYVFPEKLEKLGYDDAKKKIDLLNSASVFGKNTWRLPTVEELELIFENSSKLKYSISEAWTSAYAGDGDYYTVGPNGKDYEHRNRLCMFIPVATKY